MFHPRVQAKGTPLPQSAELTLRQFIQENFTQLRNAAELLAGHRGAQIVDAIMDSLQSAMPPDRRAWNALRDLLGILTLEHVHDEAREEAMLFARVDPTSPVVEDICLLTDGLRMALEPLVADQPFIGNLLMSAA